MTDPATSPELEPEEKTKGKRLSHAEREAIVYDREHRGMTSPALAEKYGVSVSAITQFFDKCKKEGREIVRGSKIHLFEKEVAEKAAKEALEKAAAGGAPRKETFADKRQDRIERTREQHYRGAEMIYMLNAQLLKRIVDSGGSLSPGDLVSDFKALIAATKVNDGNYETRAKTLSIETDTSEAALTVLQIEDLNQNEIDELAARGVDGEDDDDGEEILPESVE